jgi:enoyl-CoA hydratase/carnithine racemase
MEWKTIVVSEEGPVATVWLNRPEVRNAINQTMLEELAAAYHQLATRFDIRVVVLGGRGSSFCAGADRKDAPGVARIVAADASARERHWLARLGDRALEAIEGLEAVTIARIQGHAIGGGVLLATACDFRIAAEGTRFFFPEVELASPLDWRGVPRMIREIGPARAREMVMLSERVDAATAERWHLVNKVVAADQLDGAVRELAERAAGKPELSIQMSKAQFRAYTASQVLGDASVFETNLMLEALGGEQARANFGVTGGEGRSAPAAPPPR